MIHELLIREPEVGVRERSIQRSTLSAALARAQTAPGDALLRMQRQVGNRATAQWVQAKLAIGRSDDRFEREAYRVDEAIVGGGATIAPEPGSAEGAQRTSYAAIAREEYYDPDLASLHDTQRAVAPGSHLSGRDRNGTVHALAREGLGGVAGAMPHRDAIQRSFGHHEIVNVRAHLDARAAASAQAMGATAFTTGDRVAFAGPPSLHTAAHEAAHVIQQRAGVQLPGGIGETGDQYEQHADAVADLVVQGQSAEMLLDRFYAHAGQRQTAAPIQRQSPPPSHLPATKDKQPPATVTSHPIVLVDPMLLKPATPYSSAPRSTADARWHTWDEFNDIFEQFEREEHNKSLWPATPEPQKGRVPAPLGEPEQASRAPDAPYCPSGACHQPGRLSGDSNPDTTMAHVMLAPLMLVGPGTILRGLGVGAAMADVGAAWTEYRTLSTLGRFGSGILGWATGFGDLGGETVWTMRNGVPTLIDVINKDALAQSAWFAIRDTAVHEGVHAWLINNVPSWYTLRWNLGASVPGAFASFAEESVAYSAGHLAVGRLHLLPLAPLEAAFGLSSRFAGTLGEKLVPATILGGYGYGLYRGYEWYQQRE